jgi:hypothetical protein
MSAGSLVYVLTAYQAAKNCCIRLREKFRGSGTEPGICLLVCFGMQEHKSAMVSLLRQGCAHLPLGTC